MEIYIVRHGETIWNEKKLLQGQTDIELNENGKRLARLTGENLMNTSFDRIYSSPLKRAYETATLIANGRNIPIITNDLLKELSFGDWEGQNMSMLLKDDTQKFKHFFKEPHLYEPTANGETLEELCKRASTFMKNVIEPTSDECDRIMIVAHGAINKAIMMHVKKHDMKYFWSGGLQKNCNVIIIDYTDGKYNIIDETRLFYESSSL
ncbi:MAG: histidine phosphatase family protein [Coprococcus sp.]